MGVCTDLSLASPSPYRPHHRTRRYMQSLSRRGLHRTALEVCKLLLALNRDDPLGSLCTIDYLALRAGRCAGREGSWGEAVWCRTWMIR